MHRRILIFIVLVTAVVVVATPAVAGATTVSMAAKQDIDDDVPGDNPVMGDLGPGDVDFQQGNNTNYGLWMLVAICLIGAGVLLVNVERWAARRIPPSASSEAP